MTKRKQIVALLVGVLLLAGAAGTFAWLSVTGVLVNEFGFGSVAPPVDEKLNGSGIPACCGGYLLAGPGWRAPVG